MNSNFKKLVWFLTIGFIFSISWSVIIFAQEAPKTHQELKDSINKRSQELQEITDKIKENQKNLEEVQGQSKTLQKEINKVDININQVVLGVRASELTIEKLGLEIDSLGYNISETERKISEKEESIVAIIQTLQEREGENPLVIFLKNKSLAESIFETQSLSDLNNGLSIEIHSLKDIKDELGSQMEEKSDKKQQVGQESKNLKNKQLILSDVKQEKQSLLKDTKNKEQLYQKSLGDLEKRQGEIAAEVEKLEEELRLKIDPTLLPAKRQGVLGLPVSGNLTQDYGATKFAKYGYKGKWHNGIDFAAPIGTPVFAAEKGKVVSVANQDLYCRRGAYGKFVAIEHENNLTTIYAHLSLYIVREGDIIKRGDLIGYSGKTGYATGPHLHFGVYASQTFRIGGSRVCGPEMPYGGDLNPLDYLAY